MNPIGKGVDQSKERAGVENIVGLALNEDQVNRDVTTLSLCAFDAPVRAEVVAKAAGVLSGTPAFRETFRQVDTRVSIESRRHDGDPLSPGDVVLELFGSEGAILRGERTALNFLQRLSGVATMTRCFVERLSGTGVTLLDTRKTTPGMRLLEKRAVRDGGGFNHRLHLADMAMIKDNHIRMVGSITLAVEAVRRHHPDVAVEVETQDLDQFREALELPVDLIMLDNFTDEMVKRAVALNQGRRRLELSGNVTLDNIAQRVIPGISFISVGALTHSYRSLDLSLEIRPQGEKK
ncbi:MAG TPA: carboxylating nicotinate-nucleotide diphosphorylase [Candidatus Aminicenantes bacterium]|nr:carboxylating nicotinate-nucleotide diphosphorylase [Candidatus Aminicenantes bacterium]